MRRLGVVVVLAVLATLGAVPAVALDVPVVRVTSSVDTVQPLEPALGTTAASLRALKGEFESFQLIMRGPDGAALQDVDVVAGRLTGPQGVTIPARNVTVYAQRYTRIWTPSDQEGLDEDPSLPGYDRGWCQWFPNVDGGTCGIPTTRTVDGTPYNHTWKCGDDVAPVIDPRHCLIPDALVPRVDAFTGQRRNAFPLDVPAGENRAAWIDVLVPPGAPNGIYNGVVTVSAAGLADAIVPVSLEVLPVRMPAAGQRPQLELPGGVRATVSQYCAVFGCAAGTEADAKATARSYSLFVRSALEHRLPLTTVAPFPPAPGARRVAFDRWIAPYLDGTAAAASDTVVLRPRLRAIRSRLVLLDGWPAAAEWSHWAAALQAAEALPALSFYCDEYMTNKALFADHCAQPYDDAAKAGWPAGQGKPPAMLIGSQAQYTTADGWGYDITAQANRIVPNMPYHLHLRGGVNRRPEYDGGFLATPGNELWAYNSNNSLGAGDDWSIAGAYNGYPAIGGVDQPATSQRAIGFTSWGYRIRGHFYYEALHRFADAWQDCSTGARCLYGFGGHGDGTLFYPGTPARIGGTTPIPVESIRLKRYRDGSEDYSLLRLLDTGCDGMCGDHTQSQLAAIVGSPEAAGADGLMPTLWRTSVGAAAYDDVRDRLLDRIPQVLDDPTADVSVSGVAVKAPAGPAFTYRLTIANAGPETATGVTLKVDLPANAMLLRTGKADCAEADHTLTCTLPDLALDRQQVLNLALRPGFHGPLTASASVSASERDPDLANQKAAVVAPPKIICDTIGGPADDILVGTAGGQVLCGGGGDDQLEGAGGHDLLFGGSGSDAVRYGTSPHAMVVNLNFQRPDAEGAWPRFEGETGHGRDHFASIERAGGSRANDYLLGRTGARDLLWGGHGRDLIRGYGGSDRINGGPAADILHGGDGGDVVNGADGNDLCTDAADALISCER